MTIEFMAYSGYKKKLYQPGQSEAFKLSRSKIDFFLECPRCFYMDRVLGISRPSSPPFTLNVAVDALLKKEFDVHRANGSVHPLMTQYGIDAVPFKHEKMDVWRENFVGVQCLYEPCNLLIFGAVDDIWVNPKGELSVVDYKATSKEGEIFLEDTRWHNQYRRQMEVYAWLLRQNGFQVSDTGYFVYVNGKKDRKAFDAKLEFDIKIIPYTGNGNWIELTIQKIKACLDGKLPVANPDCEFCNYRAAANQFTGTSSAPMVAPKPEKKKVVPKPRKLAAANTLF